MSTGRNARPEEVRQEAWRNEIPLKLTLASDEVTAMEAPPSLYVMAPRFGFLPTVADKALPLFLHVLPPGEDTPWFDYKGLPLRWQHPLGVLYDLLVAEQERPWSLTIHFRSFPTASLLRWEGSAGLRASYFNSLKEAAVICTGGAGPIMGMAGGAQDDLWRAVLRADEGRWAEVSGSLGLAPAGGRGGRGPALPLRLLLRTGGKGYLTGYERVHYTSRPVEALSSDGTPQTLGDVLVAVLSAFHPSVKKSGPAQQQSQDRNPQEEPPGEAASTSGEGGAATTDGLERQGCDPPQTWQRSASTGLTHEGRPADVRICGISPPLDTPLPWLHSTLRNPDNFLYVVVSLS